MKEETVESNGLTVAKSCVQRELLDANAYHRLMFSWNNRLLGEAKEFAETAGLVLSYIRYGLETKYIFALCKIFAGSNEESLWKYIQMVKDYPDENIALKLERVDERFRDSFKDKRQAFLGSYDAYEKEILSIKDKLSPYRNTQRAHNLPSIPERGKVFWDQTRDWLTFAETVFEQASDGICEGCLRVGQYLPTEFDSQIDFFVSSVKRK